MFADIPENILEDYEPIVSELKQIPKREWGEIKAFSKIPHPEVEVALEEMLKAVKKVTSKK